jgi:hypothetical protein
MQRFDPTFRVWDFRVSHDQLLVRSPKNAQESKNIDIAFVGVEYMDLPTKMRDLVLNEVGHDDLRKAEDALGRVVPKDQVFAIRANNRNYLVVAAAMKVFENDLEVFESSLESFNPDS